jgi:hypothetical protein
MILSCNQILLILHTTVRYKSNYVLFASYTSIVFTTVRGPVPHVVTLRQERELSFKHFWRGCLIRSQAIISGALPWQKRIKIPVKLIHMRPFRFVLPWLLLTEQVRIQIKRDLEARSAHRLTTADTEADPIMQEPLIFNGQRKRKLLRCISIGPNRADNVTNSSARPRKRLYNESWTIFHLIYLEWMILFLEREFETPQEQSYALLNRICLLPFFYIWEITVALRKPQLFGGSCSIGQNPNYLEGIAALRKLEGTATLSKTPNYLEGTAACVYWRELRHCTKPQLFETLVCTKPQLL